MTAMNRKLFSLQSFAECVENKQFFSSKSFLNAEQFNKSTNSQKVLKINFFLEIKIVMKRSAEKTGIVFHLQSWSKK
jgi:hypothetical protein